MGVDLICKRLKNQGYGYAVILYGVWENPQDGVAYQGYKGVGFTSFEGMQSYAKNNMPNLSTLYNLQEEKEYRFCSACGEVMIEGYYLGGEYACSDKCAISLYDGNVTLFRKELEEDERNCIGEVYWTEWESEYQGE